MLNCGYGHGFSVRFACELKAFDPLRYMDRKEAKRADPYTQYAVAAAVEPTRAVSLVR